MTQRPERETSQPAPFGYGGRSSRQGKLENEEALGYSESYLSCAFAVVSFQPKPPIRAGGCCGPAGADERHPQLISSTADERRNHPQAILHPRGRREENITELRHCLFSKTALSFFLLRSSPPPSNPQLLKSRLGFFSFKRIRASPSEESKPSSTQLRWRPFPPQISRLPQGSNSP